jgi:hypothetical protein
MSDEGDRELENTESWDFDDPEVREPVKPSRVVVSVAFRRQDLDEVSECAERLGKRTSEFIREAAIDKATSRGGGTLVYASGSIGSQWWTDQMPATTLTMVLRMDNFEEALAATY